MESKGNGNLAEYRCGRILKGLVVLVQLKDTVLRPGTLQFISILGSI